MLTMTSITIRRHSTDKSRNTHKMTNK